MNLVITHHYNFKADRGSALVRFCDAYLSFFDCAAMFLEIISFCIFAIIYTDDKEIVFIVFKYLRIIPCFDLIGHGQVP